jgi:hypothetical protein
MERRQSRRKIADTERADQPAPQDEIPTDSEGVNEISGESSSRKSLESSTE